MKPEDKALAQLLAIAFVVLGIIFCLDGVGGHSAPVVAQAKESVDAGGGPRANTLDNGQYPVVGSRLYYILDFGPHAGLVSREFVPAQVGDHQVCDGFLYVTPDDVAGTNFEGRSPVFIKGVRAGGPGELGTWHWPLRDHRYTGVPGELGRMIDELYNPGRSEGRAWRGEASPTDGRRQQRGDRRATSCKGDLLRGGDFRLLRENTLYDTRARNRAGQVYLS